MLTQWKILAIAALAGFGGCEQPSSAPVTDKVTSEDLRHDVEKAAGTAAELAQQTKEDFQKQLEANLTELDAKIVTLREKGRDLKDDARVRWDQQMAELEAKRDTARARLAEIRSSSAEAWKDLQTGAESAWDDLDKAFRDASQKL